MATRMYSRIYAKYTKYFLRRRTWNLFWLFFAFLNAKCLPFVWNYRFFIPIVKAALRKPLNQSMLRRRRNEEVPLVFLPIITKTKVPLLEGDFNLHKSNSTYFTDLDTSRSLILSFLCFKGMEKIHKELAVEGKKGIMTVMLGSTYTYFKREIPTGHPYEVWSRVLTWDNKWLYIVTHFVQRGKVVPKACVADLVRERQKPESLETADSHKSRPEPTAPSPSSSEIESSIFASSISKCVFKKGRLTVTPERVLYASGLLSSVSTDSSPIDLTSLNGEVRTSETEENGTIANGLLESKISAHLDDDQGLAADIEAERVKGLRFAELLSGLEELQGQFLKDEEVSNGVIALGTFTDMGRTVS